MAHTNEAAMSAAATKSFDLKNALPFAKS